MPAEKQRISAANTCAPTLHSNAISLIYNRVLRTQEFTERMTGEYSQITIKSTSWHHVFDLSKGMIKNSGQKCQPSIKLGLHNIPKELNPAKRKRILEQRLSAVTYYHRE